ncbi:hypothetical protein [Methylobacterium sp. Leaf85]|uniref:hypothetical protein n=1 Tax=Methylobacterium sp. Leaf85 TaxID=1736241 RepID=UPI0012E6FC80|nr:hypothetical protein [Methylobacterium sp. Leaf85]
MSDRRCGSHSPINGLRLTDIGRIIFGRHRGACADLGLAERYLDAALPHIIGSRIRWLSAVRKWVARHVPALAEAHGDAWIEAKARACEAVSSGRYPSSDHLARLLGVTVAEVAEFGLRIIPAASRTKAVRTRDRLAANAAHQALKRQSRGSTPRVKSKAQTKPWVAEGVSRSSWYAARKNPANPTNPSPEMWGWTISSASIPSMAALDEFVSITKELYLPYKQDGESLDAPRLTSPCPEQSEGEGQVDPCQEQDLGREDRVGSPQPDQDTPQTAKSLILARHLDGRTASAQPEELGTVSSHPREGWPDPAEARGRPGSGQSRASADFRLKPASGPAESIQARSRCPPAFRLPPPSSSFSMPLGFLR